MARRLAVRVERWPLSRPFRIARGEKTEAEVVLAEIDDGSGALHRLGRGEAVPYARYGETAAGVAGAIARQAGRVAGGLDRAELARIMPAGAARNALDCALWDLDAKASGRRAWDLAGLPDPGAVVTAQTIGLGSCAQMAEDARRLRRRPLLKVKLDREAPVQRVAAVRAAAPGARLIVDANEAWDVPTLEAAWPEMAALGVALIEQPLPAGADHLLSGRAGPVPLCADESCHTRADLERIEERYQAVNVKLDKAGGPSEAMALVDAARARGLGVMVGCMVCTSLGIAPALMLAASADYADLDGPLWLARDRAPGITFRDGVASAPPPALWG